MPVKTLIQVESMDDDLRVGLWNALDVFYWSQFTVPLRWDTALSEVRDYFFGCSSFVVYDFIEFIADQRIGEYFDFDRIVDFCNGVLEREVAAYQFVDFKVTQITAEEEIAEIEEALSDANKPVAKHLRTALDY